MRVIALAGFLAVLPSLASANMPTLTKRPAPLTPQACKVWAASQSEDAIYMWGQLESGDTSSDVAIQRLTRACLGEKAPRIVTFGSSAGAADVYCQSAPATPICRNRQ